MQCFSTGGLQITAAGFARVNKTRGTLTLFRQFVTTKDQVVPFSLSNTRDGYKF